MKHLYLFVLVGLFTLRAALAAPLAPLDTTGRARAVKLLATDMCTRLTAENAKHPLTELSAKDAEKLLTQTMLGSISANADAVQPLLSKLDGRASKSLGEELGKDAMLLLMRQCPASQALVINMGMASANLPAIESPEEKALLDAVAQDICTRLDKALTNNPTAQKDAAERQRLFRDAMQAGMLAHLEDIGNFYGIDKLQDQALMHRFGQKVAGQMATKCPNHLLQLGLDSRTGKGKQ